MICDTILGFAWMDSKPISEDSRYPTHYLNPELPQFVNAGMYKSPGEYVL